jgi:hypothetical protein
MLSSQRGTQNPVLASTVSDQWPEKKEVAFSAQHEIIYTSLLTFYGENMANFLRRLSGYPFNLITTTGQLDKQHAATGLHFIL